MSKGLLPCVVAFISPCSPLGEQHGDAWAGGVMPGFLAEWLAREVRMSVHMTFFFLLQPHLCILNGKCEHPIAF